jgi:hypothetical protein
VFFLQTNGSGVLSFSSPSAGSFVYLAETNASNVATVDLNGYFTSDYDVYIIYIDGLYGATNNASTYFRFATGSYTVQSSSYRYSGAWASDNGAGTSNVTWAGTFNNGSEVNFTQGSSNTSANIVSSELVIYNPLGSAYTNFTFRSYAPDGNLSYNTSVHSAGQWTDTTAVTGIRFFRSSGNIYFRKARLYGIKNS